MKLDHQRLLATNGLGTAVGKPAVTSIDRERLVSTKGLTAAPGKPIIEAAKLAANKEVGAARDKGFN